MQCVGLSRVRSVRCGKEDGQKQQTQDKSVQVRGVRLSISTELQPMALMSCMLWAAPFICCTRIEKPEHVRHGPGLSCLPYSEWAPPCPK